MCVVLVLLTMVRHYFTTHQQLNLVNRATKISKKRLYGPLPENTGNCWQENCLLRSLYIRNLSKMNKKSFFWTFKKTIYLQRILETFWCTDRFNLFSGIHRILFFLQTDSQLPFVKLQSLFSLLLAGTRLILPKLSKKQVRIGCALMVQSISTNIYG